MLKNSKPSSPVDIWTDFLKFGFFTILHLLRVGNVEQIAVEVHGLWQFLPPTELICAFPENNILETGNQTIKFKKTAKKFKINSLTSLI